MSAASSPELGALLAAPIRRGEGGEIIAENGVVRLVVLDPDAYEGRIFKRRAIKGAGSPAAREVAWLVAELDGVRVYVDGDRITITRRDIYP